MQRKLRKVIPEGEPIIPPHDFTDDLRPGPPGVDFENPRLGFDAEIQIPLEKQRLDFLKGIFKEKGIKEVPQAPDQKDPFLLDAKNIEDLKKPLKELGIDFTEADNEKGKFIKIDEDSLQACLDNFKKNLLYTFFAIYLDKLPQDFNQIYENLTTNLPAFLTRRPGAAQRCLEKINSLEVFEFDANLDSGCLPRVDVAKIKNPHEIKLENKNQTEDLENKNQTEWKDNDLLHALEDEALGDLAPIQSFEDYTDPSWSSAGADIFDMVGKNVVGELSNYAVPSAEMIARLMLRHPVIVEEPTRMKDVVKKVYEVGPGVANVISGYVGEEDRFFKPQDINANIEKKVIPADSKKAAIQENYMPSSEPLSNLMAEYSTPTLDQAAKAILDKYTVDGRVCLTLGQLKEIYDLRAGKNLENRQSQEGPPSSRM